MWLKRIRSKKKLSAKPNTYLERTFTYLAHDVWGSPENEYKFEYKRVVGRCEHSWTWRIYIISMPEHFIIKNYSNIKGHWIPDQERGMKIVCWFDDIKELEDAIQLSKIWADMHQRYIATGEFDV